MRCVGDSDFVRIMWFLCFKHHEYGWIGGILIVVTFVRYWRDNNALCMYCRCKTGLCVPFINVVLKLDELGVGG